MKKFFYKQFNDLCDAFWQLCQFFLMAFIPIFFLNSHVTNIIQVNDKIKPNSIELLIYYAVRQGDFVVSLFFVLTLIKFYHKMNENKLLNTGMRYHDHSMLYYQLCAKLLGYKKCSLVRVPIGMQFRLIMNDCFEEYDDGGDDVYDIIVEDNINIKTSESINCSRIINLCIEDTYPIKDEFIPSHLQRNKTIKISRYKEDKKGIRCYSKALVDQVSLTVKKFTGWQIYREYYGNN